LTIQLARCPCTTSSAVRAGTNSKRWCARRTRRRVPVVAQVISSGWCRLSLPARKKAGRNRRSRHGNSRSADDAISSWRRRSTGNSTTI